MTKKPMSRVDTETLQIVRPAPDQLVDRKKELDKFNETLDRISRQGPVTSNLFEWFGSPGIGKTMLVTMLARQAEARQVPCAITNFKEAARQMEHILHDPVTLIESIVANFRKQASLDTTDLDKAIKEYRKSHLPKEGITAAYANMDQENRLYNRPTWLEGQRNVVIAFIRLVNTMPSETKPGGVRPVVLFFDETEHAPIDLVDWIEEWIINPLIQIKHVVIVWTARRPWRWKRPEIRRRLTSEPLDLFEPEMVKEQILSGSTTPDLATELFKNVYTLTGGHPFANFIVINELDTLAKQGEKVTPETFIGFESKLLSEIFNKFIDGYAFKELESGYLKVACKFIALVRLFDSTMLREVLRTCACEPFDSWKQEDFGQLLLQLKKTQLLVWDKGYAIDPGLRHIIQKYFMSLEQNTFIEANRAALRVYEDWLGRPVDNRGLFVLEELYHSAALSQVGVQMDLKAILKRRLKEYPEWIRDEHALENALDRLEGEIGNDKELEQYTLSNTDLAKQVQAFKESRSSLNHPKK